YRCHRSIRTLLLNKIITSQFTGTYLAFQEKR
ncbi:MAG: hypothetical protein ACI9C4_002187, partial [Paraglaciecola sp.]